MRTGPLSSRLNPLLNGEAIAGPVASVNLEEPYPRLNPLLNGEAIAGGCCVHAQVTATGLNPLLNGEAIAGTAHC